jgi:hypothetical protein
MGLNLSKSKGKCTSEWDRKTDETDLTDWNGSIKICSNPLDPFHPFFYPVSARALPKTMKCVITNVQKSEI